MQGRASDDDFDRASRRRCSFLSLLPPLLSATFPTRFRDLADPLRTSPCLASEGEEKHRVTRRRRSFLSLLPPTAVVRARSDVPEMLRRTPGFAGDDVLLPNFSWKSLQFCGSSFVENIYFCDVLLLIEFGLDFLSFCRLCGELVFVISWRSQPN